MKITDFAKKEKLIDDTGVTEKHLMVIEMFFIGISTCVIIGLCVLGVMAVVY